MSRHNCFAVIDFQQRMKGDIVFIQPYLNFEGRCDDAVAFYRAALGAEVTSLMRYKEIPVDPDSNTGKPSPESSEKICHAALRVGETDK